MASRPLGQGLSCIKRFFILCQGMSYPQTNPKKEHGVSCYEALPGCVFVPSSTLSGVRQLPAQHTHPVPNLAPKPSWKHPRGLPWLKAPGLLPALPIDAMHVQGTQVLTQAGSPCWDSSLWLPHCITQITCLKQNTWLRSSKVTVTLSTSLKKCSLWKNDTRTL